MQFITSCEPNYSSQTAMNYVNSTANVKYGDYRNHSRGTFLLETCWDTALHLHDIDYSKSSRPNTWPRHYVLFSMTLVVS